MTVLELFRAGLNTAEIATWFRVWDGVPMTEAEADRILHRERVEGGVAKAIPAREARR